MSRRIYNAQRIYQENCTKLNLPIEQRNARDRAMLCQVINLDSLMYCLIS